MNAFRSQSASGTASKARRRRSKLTPPAALVASVVFHGAVIAMSAIWVARLALPGKHARHVMPTVEVTLAEGTAERPLSTVMSTTGVSTARRPEERPRERGSGVVREPRPDTRVAGRGGSREATEKALHLSDSVDGVTLDRDPTFFTPESQLSRLETADERRSREDRRATPTPMELTFVASGPGVRLARLEPARSDPAEGASGAVPAQAGAPRNPEVLVVDAWSVPAPPRPPRDEGAVAASARGVDHGSSRDDYRRSAAVAVARPAVRQGRASIATARHGLPSDTLDSSEEVASVVQSLVTASSAGGPEGRGPGGSVGLGAPGSNGAAGPGSRARPSGEGGAEDPSSVLGIRSYAAALTRKVYPYWEDALPIWARAEGRGGMAVIGVTLGENGNVRDVHLVRGSGIPEFDSKVASALERASPYGPLPRAIRGEGLTLHIAFDAMNPAVGRAGPGAGRR